MEPIDVEVPLLLAVYANDLPAVQQLLRNPSSAFKNKMNAALFVAVSRKILPIVKALVDGGADTDYTQHKMTISNIASDDPEIMNLLLPSLSVTSILHALVCNNLVAETFDILKCRFNQLFGEASVIDLVATKKLGLDFKTVFHAKETYKQVLRETRPSVYTRIKAFEFFTQRLGFMVKLFGQQWSWENIGLNNIFLGIEVTMLTVHGDNPEYLNCIVDLLGVIYSSSSLQNKTGMFSEEVTWRSRFHNIANMLKNSPHLGEFEAMYIFGRKFENENDTISGLPIRNLMPTRMSIRSILINCRTSGLSSPSNTKRLLDLVKPFSPARHHLYCSKLLEEAFSFICVLQVQAKRPLCLPVIPLEIIFHILDFLHVRFLRVDPIQ